MSQVEGPLAGLCVRAMVSGSSKEGCIELSEEAEIEEVGVPEEEREKEVMMGVPLSVVAVEGAEGRAAGGIRGDGSQSEGGAECPICQVDCE